MRPVILCSVTCLLVCFSLLIEIDVGFSQVVGCPPNSTCSVSCPDNSHCVNITLCKVVQRDIRKGKNHTICGSWAEEEPFVCCRHSRIEQPDHPIKESFSSASRCGYQPRKLLRAANHGFTSRVELDIGPEGVPVLRYLSVGAQIEKAIAQSAANQSANIGITAITEDRENVRPTTIGMTAITEDRDNDDKSKLYGIAIVQQEEDSSYDFESTNSEVTEKYDSTPSSIVYYDEYDTGPQPWPWMVAIFDTNKQRPICGGTVVNDKHIITAAHCFAGRSLNPKLYTVQMKEISLNEEDAYHAIEDIELQEGYIPYSYYNDIAILRLSNPLSDDIVAACLPFDDNVHVGDNVTVLGWGDLSCGGQNSTSLQVIHNVTVISNSECEAKLPKSLFPWGLTHSQLCADLQEGDESCQGGSGGPLLTSDFFKMLVGLVSFQCTYGERLPVVYTKVGSYMEWIEKHISTEN